MTVLETNQIDAIGIDSDSGDVVLTIFDQLEWRDDAHLLVLQDKLNTYLKFVESREIFEQYPDAIGKNVRFDLITKYPANEIGVQFINNVRTSIENAGFSLFIRLGNAPKSSLT